MHSFTPARIASSISPASIVDAIRITFDGWMFPLQQRQRGRQPVLAAHVDQDDVRLDCVSLDQGVEIRGPRRGRHVICSAQQFLDPWVARADNGERNRHRSPLSNENDGSQERRAVRERRGAPRHRWDGHDSADDRVTPRSECQLARRLVHISHAFDEETENVDHSKDAVGPTGVLGQEVVDVDDADGNDSGARGRGAERAARDAARSPGGARITSVGALRYPAVSDQPCCRARSRNTHARPNRPCRRSRYSSDTRCPARRSSTAGRRKT